MTAENNQLIIPDEEMEMLKQKFATAFHLNIFSLMNKFNADEDADKHICAYMVKDWMKDSAMRNFLHTVYVMGIVTGANRKSELYNKEEGIVIGARANSKSELYNKEDYDKPMSAGDLDGYA